MMHGGLLAGGLILLGCFLCWLGAARIEARIRRHEEDYSKVVQLKLPPGAGSEPIAIRGAREVA